MPNVSAIVVKWSLLIKQHKTTSVMLVCTTDLLFMTNDVLKHHVYIKYNAKLYSCSRTTYVLVSSYIHVQLFWCDSECNYLTCKRFVRKNLEGEYGRGRTIPTAFWTNWILFKCKRYIVICPVMNWILTISVLIKYFVHNLHAVNWGCVGSRSAWTPSMTVHPHSKHCDSVLTEQYLCQKLLKSVDVHLSYSVQR